MNSEIELLSQKYALDKEIVKQYKLTNEEHENIFEKIKENIFYSKIPIKNKRPILSIVVGQPGCGKSTIICNEIKKYPNDNVVVINSDDIKLNHPNHYEIGKKYINEYSRITGLDGDKWTENLFEYSLDNNYNTIFEIPLRNNRVKDTIVKAKEKGYEVKIIALAVSDLRSRIGIYNRYINSKKYQGFGRFVVKQQHDETYNNMPNVVNELENITDDVEVYVWDNKETGKTKKIYDKKNQDFPNAKMAIENGRKEDRKYTIKNSEETLKQIVRSDYIESKFIKKDLLDLLNEFEIELNKTKNKNSEKQLKNNITRFI